MESLGSRRGFDGQDDGLAGDAVGTGEGEGLLSDE